MSWDRPLIRVSAVAMTNFVGSGKTGTTRK
jgi:hypothetical protein